MIAFTSSHEELLAHIYTMRPDGTELTRRTLGTAENTYPRWLRAVGAAAVMAGAGAGR